MDLVVVAALVAALAHWGVGLDAPSVVVTTAVATAAWSLFASVFWPFVACPAPFCERGKVHRPGQKRAKWRSCWWCHGSGKRTRWGRRLWDGHLTRGRKRGA